MMAVYESITDLASAISNINGYYPLVEEPMKR